MVDSLVETTDADGRSDAPAPSAPDHYDYPWTPLTAAEWSSPFVTVWWADGTDTRAHATWLFENDTRHSIEPSSREGVLASASLPSSGHLRACHVADGALVVEWIDGRRSIYHPGWLRHVADGLHLPDAPLPARRHWTVASMAAPPTTTMSSSGRAALIGSDFDRTPEGVAAAAPVAAAELGPWLTDLAEFGVARLRGIGSDHDTVERLMSHIGPIRGSNFGDVFTVQSLVVPDSTANTGLELCAHTDLPTRETPPGFQFLHCIENEVAGGHSYLTDGLAVAAHLAEHEPDTYAALTTLDWVWFNRQPDDDHRWIGPVIDLGGRNSPLTIRAFYPVRSFPAMADEHVDDGYRALRRFHELVDSPEFRLEVPFAPGDLIAFDNRQVLHGRSAFDGGGRRMLRGCYLDRDDVRSRQRVMARRRLASTAAPPTGPGLSPAPPAESDRSAVIPTACTPPSSTPPTTNHEGNTP